MDHTVQARGRSAPEALLALEGIETFFLRARFRSQHSRLPSANLSLQLLQAHRMLSLQTSSLQLLLTLTARLELLAKDTQADTCPSRGMLQCVDIKTS